MFSGAIMRCCRRLALDLELSIETELGHVRHVHAIIAKRAHDKAVGYLSSQWW